jgi:uncharacterized protein (DUF952 family)
MKRQPDIASTIYHLVTESDFNILTNGPQYIPALFEQDGFIHCTAEPDTLLAVANDYFRQVAEPVLVLVIDLPQITAMVKFEPPAPIPGGGSSHIQEELLFPHIYGPLNLDAVTGVGRLRQTNGQFAWPDVFVSLAAYKSNLA